MTFNYVFDIFRFRSFTEPQLFRRLENVILRVEMRKMLPKLLDPLEERSLCPLT